MMRALRIDKLIIAGLSATLQHYLIDSANITEAVSDAQPLYTRDRYASTPLQQNLKYNSKTSSGKRLGFRFQRPTDRLDSGALPVETLPSVALVLEPLDISAEMARIVFRGIPRFPVVGRIEGRSLLAWTYVLSMRENRLGWLKPLQRSRKCYEGRMDNPQMAFCSGFISDVLCQCLFLCMQTGFSVYPLNYLQKSSPTSMVPQWC